MAKSEQAWTAKLPRLFEAAWQCLTQGVQERDAPARHPTLATVSESGLPQARTVVLREANPQAGTLATYTDIYADKIAALRNHPVAALHVWDARQRLQLRMVANATILTGEAARERWQRLPEHARTAYGSEPTSGKPIDDAQAYTLTSAQGAFAVLWLEIDTLEVLHLGQHHHRGVFTRADGWAGQWRVP